MRLWTNLIAAILWMTTLAIGFNVSSKECFTAASWDFHGLLNCLLGIWAFTPSNIAVISCFSVFIGNELTRDPKKVELKECIRISILGGVVVFFVIFFGGSWLDKSKFLQATQEDYFTIASACIALGLAAGLNPQRINSLVGKEETI